MQSLPRSKEYLIFNTGIFYLTNLAISVLYSCTAMIFQFQFTIWGPMWFVILGSTYQTLILPSERGDGLSNLVFDVVCSGGGVECVRYHM